GVARADQPEVARGGLADVDHAALGERPAVVDPDHDRLTVAADLHHRAERQGAVRGGVTAVAEGLPARGGAAVELAGVVAGDPAAELLPVAFGLGLRGLGLK